MGFEITVIIPTYNVAKYIGEALESVVNQTFKGNVEILLIDDCSTDETPSILEDYKNDHPDRAITVLHQETNARQGTARNRGLGIAQGKYVFFLDGDDTIDPNTFEKMIEKAEGAQCDFVMCDWVYAYEDRKLMYVNYDRFLTNEYLEGEYCERLLEAATYFTVNKLYNREFLLKHGITYGEGYIYEDYEFYVEVAQRAEKIGIVSNPFYHVRVNEDSTTKKDRKTTIHIDSLVKAVEATITKFDPRWEQSYYHLYKYIVKKTMNYIRERAPMGQKRKTIKKVLTILNRKRTDYYVPRDVVPLFYFYFRRKYVQNSKFNQLILIDDLHHKGQLTPLFRKAMKAKETMLKNKTISKLNQKRLIAKKNNELQRYEELSIKENVILFLGFDYRYIGNSKYFFDYMMNRADNTHELYFVTTSNEVPSKYRVTPRSLKFYKILNQARIVIGESWIPLDFKKKDGQEWIQLWHGTPFKKLFFDSHEPFITTFNKNHKRDKQRDISRWDNLLADSPIAKEKFTTAFAYPEDRILNIGYPRVQWLKDNRNNQKLIKELKQSMDIPEHKRVILYVPTWRDYNYKKSVLDLDYTLDISRMQQLLGEDYVFINKDHSMGRNQLKNPNVITPPNTLEVQNLILLADVIISDYSSIVFDGLAIDKPFYLFINDFDKYEKARGVYDDMARDLGDFFVHTEEELAEKIVKEDVRLDHLMRLKGGYITEGDVNSNELLLEKLTRTNLVNF
ncbi:bifunctional glycosyltransferase/CDP-glycerol:glycerophosphate glycerophosphotransferase [Rossellomorea marisflavi]|uniref:bifunctional glycosyltransferase/CDP-glycerol:glycerophosphate glycerophosphotransferase n=1 Tax=Rossellomorea marisflavi TaxID=189381 RepID=UPI00345D8139